MIYQDSPDPESDASSLLARDSGNVRRQFATASDTAHTISHTIPDTLSEARCCQPSRVSLPGDER